MGSKKKKVYVSGPMRGYPNCNVAEFKLAADAWRAEGWVVFSPPEETAKRLGIEHYPDTAYGSEEDLIKYGFDRREAFALDSAWIARDADAIYMLLGWESSSGARFEHALAVACGIEIFYQKSPQHGRF